MPPITLASPGAIALHLAAVTIRWYGIMIALGFLVASWVATPLAKRYNIDLDSLLNCTLTCFMGGIVGARLYFVALNWQTFSVHPDQIIAIWLGGLSIHGGMIGALISGWIYCKINRKLPFLLACDVIATVVPVAQAIGRWGNFFNSEAFGRPVDDNFPVRLFIPPQYRPAQFANNSYFHPTFLYESAWDLAIFLILYFFLFKRLKKFPGMTLLSYIFLYSIGRAVIEPIRVDSIMVGGYAAPSVVSNILLVVSAAGLVAVGAFYRSRPKATAATVGTDSISNTSPSAPESAINPKSAVDLESAVDPKSADASESDGIPSSSETPGNSGSTDQ